MTATGPLAASTSRRKLVTGVVAGLSLPCLAPARARPEPASSVAAQAASSQENDAMKYVTAPDGVRIAYEQLGDGPPLVLVHGSADDHTVWGPVLPAFSERFTVYAVDRRAYGASGSNASEPYDLAHEYDDIATVVDSIGEPVVLFGHSFGALCSLEAALRTENLDRLILYEPPIPIPSAEAIASAETVATLDALLAAGDFEGVLLTFAREIAQLPEDVITYLQSQPSWEASLYMAPTIVNEVHAVGKYSFDPGRFDAMTTPTLLLLGTESPDYMQAATKAVAAALPHNQLLILEGEGHIAIATNPGLVISDVMTFLTAVEAEA